jgi:hypothetical protein
MATLRQAPRWWGLQLFLLALGLFVGARGAYAETKAPPQPAASASAEAATPADAALGEAKLHFENGLSLLQQSPPNYQDAHQQFLLAYEKSGRRWSILGNLALCAMNLERDGEALAHYENYLAQAQDDITANERAEIEREMLLIKGNMATVELSSVEPSTRVTVRREGSTAPAQVYRLADGPTKLGVRAGQLEITASVGDKSETWPVVLSPGDAKAFTFTFAPKTSPAAPVAAAPAPVAEPEASSSPVRTIGYVTGGVGIAALIAGVVTGVMTTQKENDARAQCNGTICPESAEADFQAASDLAMVTNVLLIGGGVLTATGVTLVIVGGKKSGRESARQLRVTPHVSPFFAGLSAHGTF